MISYDKQEVISDFEIKPEALDPFNLLFYDYDIDGYEGYAVGLLEHKETKELFTFEGSH